MLAPVWMEEVSKNLDQSNPFAYKIIYHTSDSIHGKNVCLSQNKSLTSAIQLLQSSAESTEEKTNEFLLHYHSFPITHN